MPAMAGEARLYAALQIALMRRIAANGSSYRPICRPSRFPDYVRPQDERCLFRVYINRTVHPEPVEGQPQDERYYLTPLTLSLSKRVPHRGNLCDHWSLQRGP